MNSGVVFWLALTLVTSAVTDDVCRGENHCLKDEAPKSKSLQSAKYPIGDPRNCLQGKDKMLRLEVLPGTGWDNLRNLNMGMVTLKKYSQCLTSEDGEYLIPDDTYVVPLKESNAELNSEYFDHWNNYSSMTSKSINLEAHASFHGLGLGGKFSSEFQSVKKHQVEDKSITTRVQLRYKFYTVRSQPDMQLHPDFKSRLLDIAANLQCNNTVVARYMADLLVRDYGTHYITSIDAGAILAKVDHVKSKYALNSQTDKSTITASASASFFGAFGFSASYTHRSSQKDVDTYKSNVVHSKIHTFGGPPFRANFSINDWEDGLPNNLVAIDRAGDPLHFAITPQALPELPELLAMKLSQFVLKSIQSFYRHNTIKGCIDASSPNFNFQANLDDHSCKSPYTNFTFGGVYQTCSVSGSPGSNPCPAFQQKNPKKETYACPDGYKAVLLHQGLTPTSCHRECHGWWIFKSCHNDCGYARYSTYWCVALGQVKDHSGYLFGGLYTKTMVNPVTGTAGCPTKFYPQRFGPEGMYVCISDDYELASLYSLPFAGFFSCSVGNPLSLTYGKGLTVAQGLESTLFTAGPAAWPKRCPTGYSQHLAAIDEDCEINFCAKANSLSSQGLPTIKRPPFHPFPKMNYNITIPLVIVNDDTGRVWLKDPGSLDWVLATKGTVMKAAEIDISKGAIDNLKMAMTADERTSSKIHQSTKPSRDSMAPGTAAGITIGVIACVAFVIVLAVVWSRRKGRHGGKVDRNPLLTASAHYQSVGGSAQE